MYLAAAACQVERLKRGWRCLTALLSPMALLRSRLARLQCFDTLSYVKLAVKACILLDTLCILACPSSYPMFALSCALKVQASSIQLFCVLLSQTLMK